MKRAYKTEIQLNPDQVKKANQTIGVCRYVYNLFIATNQAYYETEKKFMSGMEFSKWLNNIYTRERDFWIKEVSSKAVVVKTKPSFITIEDLNVRGMMKNKHLANRVRKQKFYYFRTWLQHKCKQKGIELRVVNRFYPSSKLCSCCGNKKVQLSLSERTYRCACCGTEIDRDLNASLNLKYATNYTVVTTR